MFIDDILIGYYDKAFNSRVFGTAVDSEGKPIAGAVITVIELEPAGDIARLSQTTTDAEGQYELVVPAGGWTVRAAKTPDYISEEQIVYAAPDREVKADFILEANLPPKPITGLQAEAGDGFVHLHWDQHEDDDVAGYLIEESLDGENFFAVCVTPEAHYTIENLQNGYTYYFRVAAVDQFGLESDFVVVQAEPTDQTPAVTAFDVQPRSLLRGGTLAVSAELNHPLGEGAVFALRLEAELGSQLIRAWEFNDQPAGLFETSVDALDVFGQAWAPNIYRLTLHAVDESGRAASSNPISIAVLAPLPQALSFLLGNNPFNPAKESQMIEYTLPAAGEVLVAVYTLDGQKVCTLADAYKEAGQYLAFWDGRDQSGQVVRSGMYVVKVKFKGADGESTGLMRHSVVVK